jgi:hypothetical protein
MLLSQSFLGEEVAFGVDLVGDDLAAEAGAGAGVGPVLELSHFLALVFQKVLNFLLDVLVDAFLRQYFL